MQQLTLRPSSNTMQIWTILHGDTDADCLVFPKYRIRIPGHFYLRYHLSPTDTPRPKLNVPILTVLQTQKNLVASSVEVETGGMLLTGQIMVPIRKNLIFMGYPQPENVNPLKSDRKTGIGIVYSFMNPKRSKPWDMKYHCFKDCTKTGHLNPYWEQVIYNWEDYFTKHHPPAYHKVIR